jgi:hypothetical protein
VERWDDPHDLTFDVEADGEVVRRQLGRRVWVHGAWATGVYRFEERGADGTWRPARVAVVRLRKVGGAWRRYAAITLPPSVAAEMGAVLAGWPAGHDDATSWDD